MRTALPIVLALALSSAGPLPRASEPDEEPGLRLAIQLQDAFARVADKVFPSVVSISAFSEDPDWTRESLTARQVRATIEVRPKAATPR